MEAGVVIASVDFKQASEMACCIVEVSLAFADLGQRLQGDDILAVQLQHVLKCMLSLGVVAQVEVAAAQHDAGRDVVRPLGHPFRQDLERAGGVLHLAVGLCQRGEREALPVFPPETFEFGDLAGGHFVPVGDEVELRSGAVSRCRAS